MLMFLMILFTSIPVLVLSCLVFAGLTPKGQREEEEKRRRAMADPTEAVAPPRFFSAQAAQGPLPDASRAVEALLSEIERHVRNEQAAAETFLEVPSRESLHSRVSSPQMN